MDGQRNTTRIPTSENKKTTFSYLKAKCHEIIFLPGYIYLLQYVYFWKIRRILEGFSLVSMTPGMKLLANVFCTEWISLASDVCVSYVVFFL
jgi:hypothetical protein